MKPWRNPTKEHNDGKPPSLHSHGTSDQNPENGTDKIADAVAKMMAEVEE